MRRLAVNWQALASEFEVGDKAQLLDGVPKIDIGRVVQVWPSIGMVDLMLAGEVTRFPVEDLVRLDDQDTVIPPSVNLAEVPGGVGTVLVPGGPQQPSIRRVAEKYIRLSLKANQTEDIRRIQGHLCCPRCSTQLRQAGYRSRDMGQVDALGCPNCLWMVQRPKTLGRNAAGAE